VGVSYLFKAQGDFHLAPFGFKIKRFLKTLKNSVIVENLIEL